MTNGICGGSSRIISRDLSRFPADSLKGGRPAEGLSTEEAEPSVSGTGTRLFRAVRSNGWTPSPLPRPTSVGQPRVTFRRPTHFRYRRIDCYTVVSIGSNDEQKDGPGSTCRQDEGGSNERTNERASGQRIRDEVPRMHVESTQEVEMAQNKQESIDLLLATHDFPCAFTFKVIGRTEDEFKETVLTVIQEQILESRTVPHSVRETTGGRHMAVTAEPIVESAEMVLVIYERLREIPGVVMLL